MIILENELSRTGKKDSFVQNICLTKPYFFFPMCCSLKLHNLRCLSGNIVNFWAFFVLLLTLNHDISIRRDFTHASLPVYREFQGLAYEE